MKASPLSNIIGRYSAYVAAILLVSETAWADEVRAVPEIPVTVKQLQRTTASEIRATAVETTPAASVPASSTAGRTGPAEAGALPQGTPPKINRDQDSVAAPGGGLEQEPQQQTEHEAMQSEQEFQQQTEHEARGSEQQFQPQSEYETMQSEQGHQQQFEHEARQSEQEFQQQSEHEAMQSEQQFQQQSEHEARGSEQQFQQQSEHETMQAEQQFQQQSEHEARGSEQQFQQQSEYEAMQPEQEYQQQSEHEAMQPEQQFQQQSEYETEQSEQEFQQQAEYETEQFEQNLQQQAEQAPKQQESEQPPKQPEQEPTQLERVGVFVPEYEDMLRAPRAAKILDMDATAGQQVRKDQILVAFDCTALRAEIEEARLTHEEAKISHQSVIASRRSGEVSADALELSQLKVEIELARLNRLRKAMETCWVKAPFSGEVRELLARTGQTVPFLEPLLELRSAAPLRFELDMPVEWRAEVELGTEFRIHAEPLRRWYTGKVVALGQTVNIGTQTILMTAEVPDIDQEVAEGMSGIAVFDIER